MGITGLLPYLRSIQRPLNVGSFKDQTVAVDGYCWLHRGAYTCAQQLIMREKDIDKLPFVNYCMRRVNMLLSKNIKVIVVFDGSNLPTKADTEAERRKRRADYLQRGKELLREGKKSEANDCFQRCVDVSPEMALALIKACRQEGVECIVAPYEADAQLAFLSKEDIVDLVITEDSDLLVYGCKRVLFKMDEIGNGLLIETSRLGELEGGKLQGFDETSFRRMCILSGCDYLSSIPGMGLATANKLMRKFGRDPYKVISHLRMQKGKSVPPNYVDKYRMAEETFLYQIVFDPRTQKQVHLTPLPEDVDSADLKFVGSEMSPLKAVGLARGNINPLTLQIMDSYSPSKPNKRGETVKNGFKNDCKATKTGWVGRVFSQASSQKKLSAFVATKSVTKQFKPPSSIKRVENEDFSVANDELANLYGGDPHSGEIQDSNTKHADAITLLSTSSSHQSSQSVLRVSSHFTLQDDSEEVTPGSSHSNLLSKLTQKLSSPSNRNGDSLKRNLTVDFEHATNSFHPGGAVASDSNDSSQPLDQNQENMTPDSTQSTTSQDFSSKPITIPESPQENEARPVISLPVSSSRKVRRSLLKFMFDKSDQSSLSAEPNDISGPPPKKMAAEQRVASEGRVREVPCSKREDNSVPSLVDLTTLDEHTQQPTLQLLDKVKNRFDKRIKQPGLRRPSRAKSTGTLKSMKPSNDLGGGQLTITDILTRCAYKKRDSLKKT